MARPRTKCCVSGVYCERGGHQLVRSGGANTQPLIIWMGILTPTKRGTDFVRGGGGAKGFLPLKRGFLREARKKFQSHDFPVL